MSSMTDRLLKRLHRVFDKDPKSIPVLLFSGVGRATISKGTLTILRTDNTVVVVDLTDKTVGEVSAEIRSYRGWLPDDPAFFTINVHNAEMANMAAHGLLETINQDISNDPWLRYPTSLFYQEMQTYANTLQEQYDRLQVLKGHMYLHSATDDWLTYWGDTCLGIPRSTAIVETDPEYLARILETITAPTQNNVALQNFVLKAFGVDIRIEDANRDPMSFPLFMRDWLPGRIYFDFVDTSVFDTWEPEQILTRIEEIKRYIDSRYKAAGIGWIERVLLQGEEHGVADTIQMTEEVALSKAPLVEENFPTQRAHWVYEGHHLNNLVLNDHVHSLLTDGEWRVGTPGIKVGRNELIVEQITVTLLDLSEVPINQYLLGG